MHPLLAEAEARKAAAFDALVERLEPEEARGLFREAEALLLKAVERQANLAAGWRSLAEVYEVLGDSPRAHEAQTRYAAAAGLEGPEAVAYALELLRGGGNLPLARTLIARGDPADPETVRAREALPPGVPDEQPPALSDAELLALKEHLYDTGLLELIPGRLRPLNNCDGTLSLTDAWLAEHQLDGARAHELFDARGGGKCDCEVLLNVEPAGIVDTLAHWKAFAVRRAFGRGRALFEEGVARACELMRTDRSDEALEVWDELAALDPEDERLLLLRGRCFQELERFEEAEGSFRRLLQLEPQNSFGHFALGTVLQDTGRLEEAERVYRQGLRTDPGAVALHWGLTAVLLERDRPEEARAAVRRALERFPDDENLLRLREAVDSGCGAISAARGGGLAGPGPADPAGGSGPAGDSGLAGDSDPADSATETGDEEE